MISLPLLSRFAQIDSDSFCGGMAHLLGSQACLESLTRDVVDIQSTAMDLLSRTGSARFPSWKYPDKVASELDMADLLECYSYSDDEDHCKLSHIILFELVIDR